MRDEGRLGRVMIVDDEEFDHYVYKRILKRSKMATSVTSYYYAEDALKHLSSPDTEKIDLIFLDINMPRMNGFEFLDAVQAELGSDFNIPVVMLLTTSLNPADRERASKSDIIKGFLNKPLQREYLQQAAQLVEQAASAA